MMLTKMRLSIVALILFGCGLAIGCSGNSTVQPPPAEAVPADAPVGEETPSTDEK